MDRRQWLALTGTTALGATLAKPSTAATGGWKNGKKWVYSITYDEAVVDLYKYAIPIHREYGFPGHLAIVSDQIGKIRDLPGSSYHGFQVMGKEHVDELCAEGWGVSCHSLSHCGVTKENGDQEVVEGMRLCRETLERPITLFTVPGDNNGHAPSIKFAEKAGVTAIMTIYDRINTKDTDLLWLGRMPMHTQFPKPFYTDFDPYKGLYLAMKEGGWVIDYNHCPMPDKPVHPAKDMTSQQLRARFDAVKEIGGDEVWIADPNEVVDFLLKDEEAIRRRESAPSPLASILHPEMLITYRILTDDAEENGN
jgi:hypothetical protein